MLRVVGMERNQDTRHEFVLLQNQGQLRVRLRGHALVCESALDAGCDTRGLHLFAQMEDIPAGAYVMLRTCPGCDGWRSDASGSSVFVAHAHRAAELWPAECGELRVLSPNGSFARAVGAALPI